MPILQSINMLPVEVTALIFTAILQVVVCVNEPLVNTWDGVIRGRVGVTQNLKTTYYAFQGIPYAEPPIGELRFQPPRPKSKWRGILDATKDGAFCVQNSPPIGSEDCLNLNIYTRKLQDGLRPLLPVMIFIHGGGFQYGRATYDEIGPDHLLDQNVIVVTLHYRLGIFGFLSTGDQVVPGNMGLKDQLMALKWIQDNIGRFGGDRGKITVFGQSAGSASISYLLQSPLSQGLFQRAIMESGVSLSTWAFSRYVSENVQVTAAVAEIDTTSSETIVAGLRGLDIIALQAAAAQASLQSLLTHGLTAGFSFGPAIEPDHDGAVITGKSYEVLRSKNFVKVPCIIGFNSKEGIFESGDAVSTLLKLFDSNPALLPPVGLNIADADVEVKAAVGKLIKEKYFGEALIQESEIEAMQFLSDDQFNRPIREYVRLIQHDAPVFFYRFSYEGGLWGFTDRTVSGVTHSEELGYLFNSPYTPSVEDSITRERMLGLWTNFAKFGDPTPVIVLPVLNGVKWKSSDEEFTYLDIGNDLVLGTYPEKTNMEFWDDIFNSYGVPPYDTY